MTGADEPSVAVNGIDATTGDYLLPALTSHDIAAVVTQGEPDGPLAKELRARYRRTVDRHYAPRHGIDAGDLGQAGWGVVFAQDTDPAVRAALRPLLEHRQRQASARADHRYREFAGEDGYRSGESKQAFMRRHGSGPAPVDPDVFPYYVLLVGGPREIPFTVQYQLGVQHAVGRLSLDGPDSYRRYAESVVEAETRPRGERHPRVSIFAPRHDHDRPTELSAEHLASPLAASLSEDWRVSRTIGSHASRIALLDQLSGPARPDVLVAAGHGIGLPCGHPRQRELQGGLLCADWPGPGHGPVRAGQWFAADGLAEIDDVDLTGMIAFLFACFGGGTPHHDEYCEAGGDPRTVAPDPFVAALPQALLGRVGGALAVVAQVDRFWSYSFLWPGVGRQTEVYRGTLASLRAGRPLGAALEYVGDRYAELASDLSAALQEVRLGRRAEDSTLAQLWTACVDARNLVVLGDPAVRCVAGAVEPPREAADRDVVQLRSSAPGADRPVEIATYGAEDPAAVGHDPATGRITGARLLILSRVALDGTASHVVGHDVAAVDAPRRAALVDLHARLIEVSLAARRATDEARGEREGG